MKQSAAAITRTLFETASNIKPDGAAGIFGTTSHEANRQALVKAIADLGTVFAGDATYDEVMARYEAVVACVDTAGLTGLISESEITNYYKRTDQIWAAIEKEYK
jgi:hypothetical protein